ncbi:MAG: asparaginase domain-containing protein [Verrucomicrobiota bacterium]|nr:asparaginase domain-containing protein [Verrucomicrobiota bacterium]
MKIKILTTGGTIDKIYFDELSTFQVGDSQIGEVLRQARVAFDYEVIPLLRKDSLELTDSDRQLIRDRIANDPHDRWLVTHGTDTMTVTGIALKGIPGKTIVLTGSMTPVRFRESDAIFNLGFALATAQLQPTGVYIAMNGQVYDPATVYKNRELSRFDIRV